MLKRLTVLAVLMIAGSVPSQAAQAVDHQVQPDTLAAKSESDTPLNRPDWWLVILGFGTLAVVAWQTKILGKSVVAAQTSADAAEISAKAAMGVAVPVLMLCEFDFLPSPDQTLVSDLRRPYIRILVKNFGQTPAFLRSYAVEFSCNEHPSDLKYPHVVYCDPGTAVEAGKSFPLVDPWVTSPVEFSEDDAAAIAAGSKTLFVYGCVRYGDVFGPSVHELRFCKWAAKFWGRDGALWAECDNPYERESQKAN